MSSIYDYTVTLGTESTPLKLGDYRDKALVLVNVASKCGLTPQYKDLQALQDKYPDRVQVIGLLSLSKGVGIRGKIRAAWYLVPCNQFKAQEPGSADEILSFCQANYGVTFPIAKKGDVNGPETQPLYAFLKEHAQPPVSDIDWNFSKFLVKDGKITWFPARSTKVADIEAAL